MAESNGNGPLPVANRAVVEGEVRRALRPRKGRTKPQGRLLLLRAVPEWRDEDAFRVKLDPEDKDEISVRVRACPTVLSVLDALSEERATDTYLVVLTALRRDDLGDAIRAIAIENDVRTVDRWDLILEAFGTTRPDPALTHSRYNWLAEALLDAQPAGGWGRTSGPVLTLDVALRRLAAVRLRLNAGADPDTVVDAAALLEWTRDRAAVAGFRLLRPEEHDGLVAWLKERVGAVAHVIFGMTDQDNLSDAIPLGLAFAALFADRGQQPEVLTARGLAVGRYFTGKPPADELLATFGEAAESLVGRLAANDKNANIANELCMRAEELIASLGAKHVAADSKVLDAGFDARLAALARAIDSALPSPAVASLANAEHALRELSSHHSRRDRHGDLQVAEGAVRIARWLSAREEPSGSLSDAATQMLRSWGWADRALTLVSRADTSRVPELASVYARLLSAGHARKDELSRAFAAKLASWTYASGATTDLLLVENILDRVAKPLATRRLPLVLVLDGMSVAAACDLMEELTASGLWLEAGRREDGREPALSTVPSITSISRTSLLTGTLCSGAQAEENAGFEAFWINRKARLFHKGELTGTPVKDLHQQVRAAILDPDLVVGVVLNTIDDMLDRGREGSPGRWQVADVTHLKAIMDEARRAGRPVVLTADHGHVLDHGDATFPVQSDSARYRSGEAMAGEVLVHGQRVLTPQQRVVAAVDEGIHYQGRKAGYHGGASPAEVVVPVVTLVPSSAVVPAGWFTYDPKGHAPGWWDAPEPEAMPVPSVALTQVQASEPEDDALFAVADMLPVMAQDQTAEKKAPATRQTAQTLGQRIAASDHLNAQRQFARRAPDGERIAALVDGLADRGGRATLGEAARITGEPAVRMSGYIAQVSRLLNVDGYPVIRTIDEGRTVELNIELLRQQFLGETR